MSDAGVCGNGYLENGRMRAYCVMWTGQVAVFLCCFTGTEVKLPGLVYLCSKVVSWSHGFFLSK